MIRACFNNTFIYPSIVTGGFKIMLKQPQKCLAAMPNGSTIKLGEKTRAAIVTMVENFRDGDEYIFLDHQNRNLGLLTQVPLSKGMPTVVADIYILCGNNN